VSLVDPNAQIRKEYLSHVVQLADGRVLTGIVVEDSSAAIVLVDANNQRIGVNKQEIESLEPSPNSLMPEGLLEKLTPTQLRDLFSHLQSPAPAQPSP
jgi:putative heme-binding domain-containing protein